jgi:filamentous hemagglutinin family protein
MNASTASQGIHRGSFRLNAMTATLWAAGLVSLPVSAAPDGGTVVAGAARIEANGTLTRIVQRSDRAIIDWRGFDLNANEAVQFQQPSAASATLNRIGGSQSTRIDGRIDANGQVFIVNPNGVVFGHDAQINVGGLLTTTANIANPDFMAGRLRFDQPGQPGAAVRNEGRITAAEGGLVALVAPSVRNDGVIAVRLGRVALATGDAFTLDLYGDNLIRFVVDAAQAASLVDADGHPLVGRLDQTGRIDAPGGQVFFMSAGAGKTALDQVINLSGTVRADSVGQTGGRIVLAGAGATAHIDGTLEARGTEAGQSGGQISLIADRVNLDQAHVDASGEACGGSIHVGGSWQGQGSGPRAQAVTIDGNSRLRADAGQTGTGGEVVVWSDGHTDFAGRISARGGRSGGDGGQVEVSGKGSLAFGGEVDAGASAGQPGILLLDPASLTVNAFEAGLIGRVLRTGTSTRLQADQDITVNAAIDGRGLYDGGGLSLDAGHGIQVNDHVITQNGAVSLTAHTGTVSLAPGKAIFTGSAPIDIVAGGTLSTGSLVTSGPLSLTSTHGAVHLDTAIEAGNGHLQVSAHDEIEVNAPLVNLRAGSAINLEAGGDVHVNAQIDGIGGTPGGKVEIAAGGTVSINQFIVTHDAPIAIASGDRTSIATTGGLMAGSGAIDVNAAIGIELNGTLDAAGGARLESTGGSIVLNAPIAATTGRLSILAGSDVQVHQPIVNLQSGASLDISALRDIAIDARIDGSTGTPGGAVTLNAGRTLTINQAISTGSGAINTHSGADTHIAATAGLYAGTAPITASAGATLESGPVVTSGAITLTAGSGQLVTGPIVAGSGPISLTSSSDLRIAQPISFGAGSSLAFTAPGNVFIDAFLSGTGNGSVAISAGGNTTVSQPIVSGTGTIGIDAHGSIAFIGSGGIYTSGGVSLLAGSTLNTGPLVAGGPVALKAGGDLAIAAPLAFGPGGALSANAGHDLRINAPVHGSGSNGATLSAGGNVSIGRDVAVDGGTLAVSGGSVGFDGGGLFGGGSVVVDSAGSIVTGTLQGMGGVSVRSGGSITVASAIGGGTGGVGLTAAGSVDINAPIATGSLGASAGGDISVNARIDTSGSIGLSAGHDVLVNEDVVATGGPIIVSAGGTVVLKPMGLDSYGAPQTHQLRAGSGGISVTAGGDLQTGSMVTPGRLSITSTGGDVTIAVPVYETTGPTAISAAHDININQVIANSTTGADLSLVAGGQINVDAKVGPWDRSDSTYPTLDRHALPGGRITMVAGGDINLNQPVATYKGSLAGTTAGALSITSTGGSVNLPANLRISSDAGAIAVTAYNDLNNGPAPALANDPVTGGYFTTGQLSLSSSHGNVIISQAIPDTTGAVTINAHNGVQINQRINTNDGDIQIFAGPGGIMQNTAPDPDVGPGSPGTLYVSDINAGRGNLTLKAEGDILPTSLRTAGELTLVSTGGQILGGTVQDSRRGPAGSTPTYIGRPSAVVMAGHAGISNFVAGNIPSLRAISDAGSIINLSASNPELMVLVAATDITGLNPDLGSQPSLYAGRNIQFGGDVPLSGSPLIAKAGGDLTIDGLKIPAAVLSAGSNPFVGLTGLTIGGVAVPAWTSPGGTTGSVAITSPVWVDGNGGLMITATRDVQLPAVHISGPTASDTHQGLSLTAGRHISINQLETIGPVELQSTAGNITINSSLGAHVAPDPTLFLWNPADIGLASLSIIASAGNINMHEARAVGNITIKAPNGQINFAGGLNGVESATGTRDVTDSDGVAFTSTIDPTVIARMSPWSRGGPGIAVGPTIVGPGAPAIPGALPPAAPASIGIAAASPTLAGAATPSGGSTGGGTPGAVGVTGGSTTSAAVGGTANPGSGDSFGEIFVVDASIQERKADAHDLAETEPAAPAGDNAVEGGPEPATGPEKRKKLVVAAVAPEAAILVFEGGRGEAREKDFGREERIEYNRVKP